MAGLVPAIHVLFVQRVREDVDARTSSAKTRFALLPGHDGGVRSAPAPEVSPTSRRLLPCRKIPSSAAPDAPCSGTSNPSPSPAVRHCRPPPRTAPPPRGGASSRNPTD